MIDHQDICDAADQLVANGEVSRNLADKASKFMAAFADHEANQSQRRAFAAKRENPRRVGYQPRVASGLVSSAQGDVEPGDAELAAIESGEIGSAIDALA